MNIKQLCYNPCEGYAASTLHEAFTARSTRCTVYPLHGAHTAWYRGAAFAVSSLWTRRPRERVTYTPTHNESGLLHPQLLLPG